MRRILSVLLENESGALSRVIGLFSQRGYNIESLTVAPTDDPTLSRMTIQTVGDEKVLEQIEKQLHKLVDVLRVSELGQGAHSVWQPAHSPINRKHHPVLPVSNHRHSHDCELLNKIQTGKHFDEFLLTRSLPPDGER